MIDFCNCILQRALQADTPQTLGERLAAALILVPEPKRAGKYGHPPRKAARLATLARCSRTLLYSWLADKSVPKIDAIERIATALAVYPAWIAWGVLPCCACRDSCSAWGSYSAFSHTNFSLFLDRGSEMSNNLTIPEAQWIPCTPAIVSPALARDPDVLLKVVQQFGVEMQPRYKPTVGPNAVITHTWCNIFLWDVTRALCAEIPHWIDDHGLPVPHGHGHETTANDVCDWLRNAPEHAWIPVGVTGALDAAGQGKPAVVVWQNPRGGSGHVAVLLPPASFPDVAIPIAQAGARNFVGKSLATGFGARQVEYWIHA